MNNQTSKNFELILVDSKRFKFKSASEALNYGVSKSTGEYLVFCHQDVYFLENNSIQLINDFFEKNSFGIAGVAGMSLDGKVYSSVVQGKAKTIAGIEIFNMRQTFSVDECLFFIKKENFKGFNEIGETWHCYSLNYCLECIERGEPVVLLPLKIWHLSPGLSLNKSYFKTIKYLCKLHKCIKIIYCTMGIFKNNKFLSCYIFYQTIKIKILKLLKLNIWKE